jgi:hypothetical protein
MERPSDKELDLLLSQGRLRGPVAEQARERLLDAVAPAGAARPRRLRFAAPAIGAAAAASIAVVLMVSRPEDTGFRPKGAIIGQSALLGATCSNGTPAACRRGARVSLAFAPGTSGNLGVYAEREGGGPRIWYFSVEDGEASLTAAENGGPALPSRSIVLGPEHAAGTYRVQVVVASRPLRRAEILDPATVGIRLRTSVSVTVVDP